MRIEYREIPKTTIDKFAEQHDLLMVVCERCVAYSHAMRYYAHFDCAEIKEGDVLRGVCGDGNRPNEAIDDYASLIEMKTLVIDAMKPTRREIQVPRLIDRVKK